MNETTNEFRKGLKLYKAIADFQQECPVIHKGTTGHNYTYADLPAIFKVIMPLLKKHKLGFIQPLQDDRLQTIVFHIETGETITSEVTIPQIVLRGMNEYQSLGSGITYYRRYALASFFGLVTDKDTDAAGEKEYDLPAYLKKHKNITDLTLAIDFCENVQELAKLHIKAEDVAVKISVMENFTKTLRAKSEEHIIDFLDKCPKGKYDHLGASLSLKDTQTYDYAAYSPRWAELQAQIEVLKAEQKDIEENGKKFERGQIPLKSYKQSFVITLNK